MNWKILAAPCLMIIASGCSTIIDGTSQKISVNTNPMGATCTFDRKGQTIATLPQTPGQAIVDKTKDDITVFCEKTGYQKASYVNHSGAAGATFGNIIAGGLVGWAVDSASGADNRYESVVNIILLPENNTSLQTPSPTTSQNKTIIGQPLTN